MIAETTVLLSSSKRSASSFVPVLFYITRVRKNRFILGTSLAKALELSEVARPTLYRDKLDTTV